MSGMSDDDNKNLFNSNDIKKSSNLIRKLIPSEIFCHKISMPTYVMWLGYKGTMDAVSALYKVRI